MINIRRFKQTLRDYQQRAIDLSLAVPAGGRLLLAAPTGTGKGSMELGLLQAYIERGVRAVIATPSLEVVRGYLERCGATEAELSGTSSQLAALGELINVWTPTRLRNALANGRERTPDVIIDDEAHHATDDNIAGGGLRALAPRAKRNGFTATPYRATPEDTRLLHDAWGKPEVILTVPQAIAAKAWSLPRFDVVPLVDDDTCGIKRGELDSDEVSIDAIDPLTDLVFATDLTLPTCVVLPSKDAAYALAASIEKRGGLEHYVVLEETTTAQRARAYARCRDVGALLISVRVLSEGVDFPWLRQLIDAAPTLSPMKWMQMFGRITRPGEKPSRYIGTNRNLERHGYLLQGALPRDVMKMAQEKFGGPTSRGGRVGMLKCVAKAKPIELPLIGGVKGTMWTLWYPSTDGGPGYEHCIMMDPTSEKTVSGKRQYAANGAKYQDMVEAPLPEKTEGFQASKLKGLVSPAQLNMWQRHAARVGLDPTVTPTKAQFFALPTLLDLKVSLTEDGTTVPVPDAPKASAGASPTSPEDEADRLARAYEAHVGRSAPVAPAKILPPPGASPIKRGYFTVVREDGTRRTYRVSTMPDNATFAPGKTVVAMLTGPDNTSSYSGLAFADSNGVKVWSKWKNITGEVEKDWASIVGDVAAAGKRYALVSNNCFICGRVLTTPESIAAGIGPVCAEEGWL